MHNPIKRILHRQNRERYDLAVRVVDEVFDGRESEIATEIDARWFPVLKFKEWFKRTVEIMFQNTIDDAREETGTFGSLIADSMKAIEVAEGISPRNRPKSSVRSSPERF